MNHAVYCTCRTESRAKQIVDKLMAAGFDAGHISAMFPDREGIGARSGALVGAGSGTAFGGTLAVLAGLGAVAIPGLGPFLAAGPIFAALAGAAAGGAVGGVTGALVGLGIHAEQAKVLEGRLLDGGIVLAAQSHDRRALGRAREIFQRGGAADVSFGPREHVPEEIGSHLFPLDGSTWH